MTYTTVHKVYPGETLQQAVTTMMLDEHVWNLRGMAASGERGETFDEAQAYPFMAGEPKGYAVESWEWDAEAHELTVNFR